MHVSESLKLNQDLFSQSGTSRRFIGDTACKRKKRSATIVYGITNVFKILWTLFQNWLVDIIIETDNLLDLLVIRKMLIWALVIIVGFGPCSVEIKHSSWQHLCLGVFISRCPDRLKLVGTSIRVHILQVKSHKWASAPGLYPILGHEPPLTCTAPPCRHATFKCTRSFKNIHPGCFSMLTSVRFVCLILEPFSLYWQDAKIRNGCKS